jgi:MYXO-CTERM domain-containing protein
MTGYLDGECDINEGPIVLARGPGGSRYCGGKVSYLGGHSYAGSRGQRLFLNALFEADCVTNANWPGDVGNNDSDGDGVPDPQDPAPNDPTQCGDIDRDTCDDCSVDGFSNPSNDGPDADGDGTCDAGEEDGPGADGDGTSDGCGCRTTDSGSSLVLLFLVFGAILLRRRRL